MTERTGVTEDDSALIVHPPNSPDEQWKVRVRPRPPSLLLRIVALTGRTLIGAGLLVLAFAGYQLWATGLQTARHQSALRDQFTELLGSTTVPAASTTLDSVTPGVTTVPPTTLALGPLADVGEGDPIARLQIPRIDLDKIVVSGVDRTDLQKGPGHYPDTPLPGQLGNAAIAGHRTTFGAPFYRVNELHTGDEIVVTTVTGRYRYVVNHDPQIVSPDDVSVLHPTEAATLTLTSCNPRYSARQRIVITATLDETASPEPLPAPTVPPTASTGTGGDDGDPATVAIENSGSADRLEAGWFSEPKAWPPTIGYGLVCVAIAVGGWWISRRRHWLLGYGAIAAPFIVGLYFFFENVSRLLPPNI